MQQQQRRATRSTTSRLRVDDSLHYDLRDAADRRANWAAVSAIVNSHRRLYATLAIRLAADGVLHTTHAVIERVRKSGSSTKPFTRLAVGVGLHADGSSRHNACLVLDVPACVHHVDDDEARAGRVVAEVVALSAFDVNGGDSAPRKPCVGGGGTGFTRTWLAVAAALARGLGCTHLALEDAANARRSDGTLQLISELTLLASGETLYEKFGFVARAAPLPAVFRELHTRPFSTLNPAVVSELDVALPTELLLPTVRVCDLMASLRALERGEVIDETVIHRVAHAIYEDARSSSGESTSGIVREYELPLARIDDDASSRLRGVLQLESITVLGDDAGADLEYLNTYDVDKLDVVLSAERGKFV